MADRRPNRTPNPSPEREIRVFAGPLQFERRAEGDTPKIVGHAAVFDQWATLYEGTYWTWREVIRPGAFRNALAEKQDVVALVNHDEDSLLARTVSGTLTLSEDPTGLLAQIDPPDTQCARDLLVSIARGDLSGMSFAFRVRPGGDKTTITIQGEKELEERELLDLDLEDVSIVCWPAYTQTDVAIRSLAEVRDRPRPHHTPRRNRAERLLRLAEVV